MTHCLRPFSSDEIVLFGGAIERIYRVSRVPEVDEVVIIVRGRTAENGRLRGDVGIRHNHSILPVFRPKIGHSNHSGLVRVAVDRTKDPRRASKHHMDAGLVSGVTSN
jgi:hypothetical protein